MSSLRDLKARARVSYGVIAGMLVFAYFIYHSVEGDRGLLALNNVNVRIAEAEKKLAELVYKKKNINFKKIYFPFWWGLIAFLLKIIPINFLIKLIKNSKS